MTGGVLLTVGLIQSQSGGYLSTPSEDFATPTAVLLTDEVDVGSGRPADPEPDLGELARIRVRVGSANPRDQLFVGIGNRDAVHRWLAGTAHDEFARATTTPFRVVFTRHPGSTTARPPPTGPRWVATASGRGSAVVEWDKSAGPWSLVVMNTDGHPGLDVRADLGFRFPFLLPVGVALMSGGVLVLAADRRGRIDVGVSDRRSGRARRTRRPD